MRFRSRALGFYVSITARQRKCVALTALLFLTSLTSGQVSVTTYHNDKGRTGQNLSEPYLKPSNVNTVTFGKLFSVAVDGYVYGQPLVVPGVSIPGKGIHDVVYVVTEHDSVFALDANSNTGSNSQPLWQVSFIDPANGVTTADLHSLLGCDDIIPEVGITSTPVIDTSTGTMYVVAKTVENGTFVQRLHALDITNGIEKFGGPVVIQAQVPGGGSGSALGYLQFDPVYHNQRAALLLQNGFVYIAWGSHCDLHPWHGWVMAYDAQSLRQVGAWVSTPNGIAGGVWQGGDGLAADADSVYFSTGNGTYSLYIGGKDAGDTVLKISPPVAGSFDVIDFFTPFNQDLLRRDDRDLGSGGVMLIPDQPSGSPHPHLLVAGDKEGNAFLIDRDNMGGYSSAADTNLQTLVSISKPIFSTSSWWHNRLFVGSGGKPLQALDFNPSTGLLSTTPSSIASNVLAGRSGTASISANGNSNAIAWVLDNGGSANLASTVLYAYDAANLGTTLYSSKQAGMRDKLGPAVKFTVPTVANGKVYVGTANRVDVLGLFANLVLTAGGGQTGIVALTLPIALRVTATSPDSGNPVAGATLTLSDGGKQGTFSNAAPVTDSTGTASTTYTLPKKAQTVTITVSAPGFTTIKTTESGVAGPPAAIIIKSGNNQIGPPSTRFPNAFVVKVTDQYANAVGGATVNFSDGGAGGTLSPSSVNTNSQGLASTIYTTPPNSGNFKVKAIVSGVSKAAVFSVTVR